MADNIAKGTALGVQHMPAPLRAQREIHHIEQCRFRRRGKAVFNIAVALAEYLQIGRQNQRRAIRRFRPLDEVFHKFAVTHHIQLEPERLAGIFRYILNRTNGHGGKRKRHAEFLRRFRRENLAIGIHHAGKTGGGDSDRHFYRLANHRRLQRAVSHIDQHALLEFDGVKIAGIVVQRTLRP